MSLDELLADQPVAPPSYTGATGRRAKPAPDPAVARRNRRNRNRGKGTSRDLAEYLGWQNVEGLLLPWDVQCNSGRLQSKRDMVKRGPAAALALIDYIPAGDWLRGLYHVGPGQRLTSGSVTCRLEEWVAWHGWTLPTCALAVAGGVALITMPLPVFAEVHGRELANR